jgi:signal peptidase II
MLHGWAGSPIMSTNYIARLVLLGAVLVSCVGCDQFTKQIARDRLNGTPTRSFLSGTVRLIHAENSGAFLG